MHLASRCGGKAQVDMHETKPFSNNAHVTKSMDTSKVKKDDIFADADKVMDINNDGIKAKEEQKVVTEPVIDETKEPVTEPATELVTELDTELVTEAGIAPIIESTDKIIEEVSNAKLLEKQEAIQKAPKSKGTTRKISPNSKMKQK